MPYIRDTAAYATCFPERADYDSGFAPKADLALVYGLDASLPERLCRYRGAGYRCAVMFGIAWGDYGDYLRGACDGKEHSDEGQRARDGRKIVHNPGVPYLVPTGAFCDHLVSRLKTAVDAGAEGAVIEEPELYAEAGYAGAFRRAFEAEYGEAFSLQHESEEAMLKSGCLKAKLYERAIARVARGVKAYAASKGRSFFIWVATHSAINYSQWQIVSPVGRVGLLKDVDGLIGQVWTGTARTAQMYGGRVRERVFETALLEYASLTAAAGEKPIWLLTDPIEDSPSHSWEMYRKSYADTLLACLMQPGAKRFELCPWPRRVFFSKYPRVQPNIANKDESSFAAGGAKPIPEDYASVLCGVFEMLGNMPEEEGAFEGAGTPLCLLLSDSCLCERRMPDSVPCDRALEESWFKLLCDLRNEKPMAAEKCSVLLQTELNRGDGEARLNAFRESTLSPDLFGLTLPLVKYGLPLRFQFTSHITENGRMGGEFKAAILSYDFMKPESPEFHETLRKWVSEGGRLIFVGGGSPFSKNAGCWWNERGYDAPEEHLFESMGLGRDLAEGEYVFGKGSLTRLCMPPALIGLSAERADMWRNAVKDALSKAGCTVKWRNYFRFERGEYVFCAVMDESVSDEPLLVEGSYADMLSPSFEIRRDIKLLPGERAILRRMDKTAQRAEIVGTQARVEEMRCEKGLCRLTLHAQKGVRARVRLKLAGKVLGVNAVREDGADVPIVWETETICDTVLVEYWSTGERVTLTLALGT